MATAKQIAARKLFAQRAKSGAFRRKRAKNPRGRSQMSVYRVSQASGKKPTKRLVQRRAKTKRSPKGFFANPRRKKAYYVEGKHREADRWEYIGQFAFKTDAENFARYYHSKYRGMFVRVVEK